MALGGDGAWEGPKQREGGLGKGWVLEGQGLGRRMGRTGEAEGRSIGFW